MTENPRKEDWIAFTTPDGRQRIGDPAYIKRLLKLPECTLNDISFLKNRLRELEQTVEILDKPNREKQILTFMATLDKPRTWGFIQRRLPKTDWFDFYGLVKEGKIHQNGRLYDLLPKEVSA